MHVESASFRPMHKYFVDAANELGIEELDLNGPQREGVAACEFTQKNGRRYGTYSAFLKPFVNRKNLRISKYSHVTKVKQNNFLLYVHVSGM